jgi:galactokinase
MSSRIASQIESASSIFQAKFGNKPVFGAVAPGRVNLIGEHTDYNDGFVLPMAIERQTVVLAAPSSTSRVRLFSTDPGAKDQIVEFTPDASLAKGTPAWANYVKGVVAGFVARGVKIPGFDAVIDSTVPLGGGLSSSASLEVAFATLLESITDHAIPVVDKALLCQTAEHKFAGVPCGIMDQFISALGQADHAMLLDCRTKIPTQVPLLDPNVSILIANTNVKHELTGGEYAQRRAQCEVAAKVLGVSSLRDVDQSAVEANRFRLDHWAYRRARHVVGEIARTTHAADAASRGSWNEFGMLMLESHSSLRDDFEVSCAELDLMVDFARELIFTGDVYGSRMTGGGFGGCTVSLVRSSAVDRVTEHLHARYLKATSIAPTIFASRPARGAHAVSV